MISTELGVSVSVPLNVKRLVTFAAVGERAAGAGDAASELARYSLPDSCRR